MTARELELFNVVAMTQRRGRALLVRQRAVTIGTHSAAARGWQLDHQMAGRKIAAT